MSEILASVARHGKPGRSLLETPLRKQYRKQWRKTRGKLSNRRYARESLKKDKIACLRAYGGRNPACACCGEADDRFLTIDHVNNDGKAHRAAIDTQRIRFYLFLKKANFPNDPPLQVLCFNCNLGKRVNRGVCPHKDKKNPARVGGGA